VTVHSAPEDRPITTPRWNIVFFRQKLESAADCGQIHPGYFVVNLDTFSEVQCFSQSQ
jgi:hypothetical protein